MGEKHHYGSFVWHNLGKFARIFIKDLLYGSDAAVTRVWTRHVLFPKVFPRCFILGVMPVRCFFIKRNERNYKDSLIA